MSIDDVRDMMLKEGYSPSGERSSVGEVLRRDSDHVMLLSGHRVLVCAFGIWRSFSASDAMFLGTRQMERITKMLPNAEGVEDTTQYALWLLCDQYHKKQIRETIGT